MRKRILNALTNNIWYKLFAVVLAFVLWLVVYNINDPNVTKTFIAKIVVVNENEATTIKDEYYYELSSNTARVSVTGKRSVINQLSDGDIIAAADFSRAEILEDGAVATVPLEYSSSRFNNQVKISSTAQMVDINLEHIFIDNFAVFAVVTGEPADGYAVNTVSVTSPTMLKIKGPESVVKSIERVEAAVNVSGYAMDFTDSVTPKLYDKNGEPINTNKLTFSSNQIIVSVTVLNTKTVPLNFSYTGTPANALNVKGITSDISTVQIKGLAADLNMISEIVVPAEVLNMEGKTDSLVTTIDISEYLPEGVSLVKKAQGKVTVTVHIEKIGEKEYTISTSTINVLGLGNRTITFTEPLYKVVVSGKESELDVLTTSQLVGTIDVSNISVGEHTANVSFNIGGGCDVETVKVAFTLADVATDN